MSTPPPPLPPRVPVYELLEKLTKAVQLWNSLPPNLLLTGATRGWRGVLKQA